MGEPIIRYPEVYRDDTAVENHFGIEVKDPYRWLENVESEQVKKFVEEQNQITIPYLDSCPLRDYIHSRLQDLCNYPKYSCPFRVENRYFYFKNSGLQNQMVLYKQNSLDGLSEVFLDPNELSQEGNISLHSYSFSEDGQLFAYGMSECGSDWFTVRFKNVANGKDYSDVLRRLKFSSLSWTHDGCGLFYSCYPELDGKQDGTETTANTYQKLYYHRIGTTQNDDVLVAEFPENPRWRLSTVVSHCGNYLILFPWDSCRDNLLLYTDLHSSDKDVGNYSNLSFVSVVSIFQADYRYITNVGQVFYMLTNCSAPNYRIIAFNITDLNESNWHTVVAEHDTEVLEWASRVDDNKLVTCYLHDVRHVLKIFNLFDGSLLKVLDLGMGTISGYSAKRFHAEMFFKFENFLSPGKIYRVDFTCPEIDAKVYQEVQHPALDTSGYVTHQVFYETKDGTQIPMFLTHRKDFEPMADHFCRLYGYGGFNIAKTPTFFAPRLAFLDMFDGVLAQACIRGGGEYGNCWYEDGTQLKKQNCFDDFHAAAEYLIQNKYTRPSKLVIQGGSNGGLLVAASINQRPELFGAAIIQVGVLDLLRFHKFTVGFGWVSDYGSPNEEEHLKNLVKLSPLHNVKVPENENVQYPATLLLTADHDDRVVPLHSFKFIAELQHQLGAELKQTNPLLLRVQTNVGHGAGKSLGKVIEEYTDIISFIFQSMEVDFKIHQ